MTLFKWWGGPRLENVSVSNNPPGEMPPEWWEEHMHTQQELRIIRSGLKSRPGAFEESISAMELQEKERQWFAPEAVQARKVADALARLERLAFEVNPRKPKVPPRGWGPFKKPPQ